MHDALFDNQKDLSAGALLRYAEGIGLGEKQMVDCLATDTALARVLADLKEAERLGVRATPTLFLGRVRPDGGVDLQRKLNGALPVEAFLDEAMKLTQG